MSRRDGAIVAWHEVPGTAPPQRGRSQELQEFRSCRSRKAPAISQWQSLIGANKICAEDVLLYGVVFPGIPGSALAKDCCDRQGTMRSSPGTKCLGEPHLNAEGVRSYRSSGVAGVGKASSDISMPSLIGASLFAQLCEM
jgi:hypothetical protein